MCYFYAIFDKGVDIIYQQGGLTEGTNIRLGSYLSRETLFCNSLPRLIYVAHHSSVPAFTKRPFKNGAHPGGLSTLSRQFECFFYILTIP